MVGLLVVGLAVRIIIVFALFYAIFYPDMDESDPVAYREKDK